MQQHQPSQHFEGAMHQTSWKPVEVVFQEAPQARFPSPGRNPTPDEWVHQAPLEASFFAFEVALEKEALKPNQNVVGDDQIGYWSEMGSSQVVGLWRAEL